jgi:hypothetical protein
MQKETQTAYYDERHGGPWDRGSADAWYGREFNPHYFVGDTHNSPKIEMAQMTAAEITAYTAGYRDTEFNAKGD